MTAKAGPLSSGDEEDMKNLADTVYRAIGTVQADKLIEEMTQPSVQIIEQPAPKTHRFRYPCEGRSAGSLFGVNSKTLNNKTYPTIWVINYEGHITIRVSCVTKDFMAHPNGLVGKHCQHGVFTVNSKVTANANTYPFTNLGIQCTKKNEVAKALRAREIMKVDPFHRGFDHISNPSSIDRHAVRLAFQVFVHGADGGLVPLPAVASHVIYDKKAISDLLIMDASHDSGPVSGDTQIFLFCEKVPQGTQVQFYEENATGATVWSAVVAPTLVHKLVALKINTPRYPSPPRQRGDIKVQYRLIRYEKDEMTGDTRMLCSNSHPFTYIPDVQESTKRKKIMSCLQNYDEESTLTLKRPSTACESPLLVPKNEEQQHWLSPQAIPSSGTNPFVDWTRGRRDAPLAGGPPPYAGSPLSYAGSQLTDAGSTSPYAGSQSPYAGSTSPYAGSQSPYAGSQSPYAGTQSFYAGCTSPYAGDPPPYTTHDLSNMGRYTPCSVHGWPSTSGSQPYERRDLGNAGRPLPYPTRDSPGVVAPHVTQGARLINARYLSHGSHDAGGAREIATWSRPCITPPLTVGWAGGRVVAGAGTGRSAPDSDLTPMNSPASLLDASPPDLDLLSPITPTVRDTPPDYQPRDPASLLTPLPDAEPPFEGFSVTSNGGFLEDEENLSEILRKLSTTEIDQYCQ